MKQAMIFAAGLGTRLRPLTDTMPKALVSVGGRTLLDWTIGRLADAGYGRFVVNVHHLAQQLTDYIAEHYSAPADWQLPMVEGTQRPIVSISDERDCLLDTGGGLKKAAPLFADDEPVLIHNVDILDNVDYHWFRRQHRPDEDAVLLVSRRETTRYLLFDHSMRLMGWTNTQTGEVKSPYEYVRRTGLSQHGEPLHRLAFSGIHSFSPRLFRLMDRFPQRFSIIDFYLSVCHRARIYGVTADDLQILDVGKPGALAAAEQFIIQTT